MDQPDYNHLTVATASSGSAGNPKSLVRNNSVATLNQIYQHQNTIPARNRILNTTKSLQQPSIDLVNGPDCPVSLNSLEQQQSGSCYPQAQTGHYAPANKQAQQENNKYEQTSSQPFLVAWSSRMGQVIGSATSSNHSSSRNQTGPVNNINITDLSDPSSSIPVQIINVARRHKKQQHHRQNRTFAESDGSQQKQPIGGRPVSENRKRRGIGSALSQHSVAIGYSSDSSSSCSGSSGGLHLSPAGNHRANSVQAPPLQQQKQQPSPNSWSRNSNLEVIQTVASGVITGSARGLSRSPSPSRQQLIQTQQQQQQQLSTETSPTHFGQQGTGTSGRRRMLPLEPQARQSVLETESGLLHRFPKQQVISQASDEGDKSLGGVKKVRKLPQIPGQFVVQQHETPLAGPWEQLSSRFSSSVASTRAHPPPIVARSNKSSLSSSSSSSNSPSVPPTRPPVTRSNSRVSQQQQLSGCEPRIQSFQPAASFHIDQTAVPAAQIEQQPIQQLAVKFNQQTSSESNSINTDSFHSSSPRTPMGVGGARANYQQAMYQSRSKLSAGASSVSPQTNSPAASAGGRTNTNGWYFTFDHSAGSLERNQEAANFVCFSPGGSRFLNTTDQGQPSQLLNPTSTQQNQLATGAFEPQLGTAGRGRRLSSCGSGLRANFLMNKQQAISEFTPPRSLESNNSRGSNDWPHIQPSSETCLVQQVAGSLQRCIGSGERACADQLSVESSGDAMNFRSSSAQNIIQRNISFGQQANCLRPIATTSSIAEPERIIGYKSGGPTLSIGPTGRRRSQVAGGLPPRAASATESTSTGPGIENYQLSASQFQARSMTTVPALARTSQRQPAALQTNNHHQARMWLSPGGSQAPEGPNGSSLVQLRPRLGSNAMLAGVPTAVSIDVYHCEPGSSRNSFDGYNVHPEPTNSAFGNNKSPLGSQLIPGPRDRQPSNVSTNSMPAVSSFRTNSLSPGSSSQLNTGKVHKRMLPSPASPQPGGSPNQEQVRQLSAGSSSGRTQRKFGAWVDILGSGGGQAATSRWHRSASQLGAHPSKQSSSLSKSFSPSSSSSSSIGRGNQRDDDDSNSSSSSLRSSSSLSSSPLASYVDDCLEQAENQHEQTQEHLSSGGDSSSDVTSSASSLYGGASRSRRRVASGTAGQRHRQRHSRSLVRQKEQRGNQGRAKELGGGGGQTHRLEQTSAGNADQLTLCDKLKLAERSASKLFPKVDLSSSSSTGPQHPNESNEQEGCRATQLPPAETSDTAGRHSAVPSGCKQLTGDRRSPSLIAASSSPCQNKHERDNNKPTEDDNGDDLSLLLRSAERELQEERLRRGQGHRQSVSPRRGTTNDNKKKADLNLKRGWLRTLSKLQTPDNECQPTNLSQELQAEGAPTGSVRRSASRAARVVRRAMTLKSLVKNLGSHRANSAGDSLSNFDNANPAAVRSAGHLLTVSGGGGGGGDRTSPDGLHSAGNLNSGELLPRKDPPSRSGSASHWKGPRLSSGAIESLGSRAVTKLRAALLFRRAKGSSSNNTSSELDINHPPSHATSGGKNSELPGANNRPPPHTPTSLRSGQAANNGPRTEPATACFDPSSSQKEQQQQSSRSKRSLNKMKSVITTVSKTLEPLKVMGHLKQQQSMYSGSGNASTRIGSSEGRDESTTAKNFMSTNSTNFDDRSDNRRTPTSFRP